MGPSCNLGPSVYETHAYHCGQAALSKTDGDIKKAADVLLSGVPLEAGQSDMTRFPHAVPHPVSIMVHQSNERVLYVSK